MFFFQYKEDDGIKFKPRSVEHAYLAILNDDLVSAEAVFESLDSPRALWGCTLIQILQGFIKVFPTYFQIRNFLEIDLDFLLKNQKIDYVEQVLGALEVLADINQETYKYVARVMFENRLFNAAKKYLDKSKTVFYNDPELHYMFAKYHMQMREYKEAGFYIDECLRILPDYYPAKHIKTELNKYLG